MANVFAICLYGEDIFLGCVLDERVTLNATEKMEFSNTLVLIMVKHAHNLCVDRLDAYTYRKFKKFKSSPTSYVGSMF